LEGSNLEVKTIVELTEEEFNKFFFKKKKKKKRKKKKNPRAGTFPALQVAVTADVEGGGVTLSFQLYCGRRQFAKTSFSNIFFFTYFFFHFFLKIKQKGTIQF
jgi:hypothetical protein